MTATPHFLLLVLQGPAERWCVKPASENGHLLLGALQPPFVPLASIYSGPPCEVVGRNLLPPSDWKPLEGSHVPRASGRTADT